MHSILVTFDDTPSCAAAERLGPCPSHHQPGGAIKGDTASDLSDIDRVEAIRSAARGTPTPIWSIATNGGRLKSGVRSMAELPEGFHRSFAAEGIFKAPSIRWTPTSAVDFFAWSRAAIWPYSGRDARVRSSSRSRAYAFRRISVVARGCRPEIETGPTARVRPVLIAYTAAPRRRRPSRWRPCWGCLWWASGAHVVSVWQRSCRSGGDCWPGERVLDLYGRSKSPSTPGVPVLFGSSDHLADVLSKSSAEVPAYACSRWARSALAVSGGAECSGSEQATPVGRGGAPLPLCIDH